MKMTKRRQKHLEKDILCNKRGYKQLVYNRVILYSFIVLLQIALSAYIVFSLYARSETLPKGLLLGGKIALAASKALSLILVLHILSRTDRPSDKLNWLIIILVFPVIGVLLYFYGAEGKQTKKLRKKIFAEKEKNEPLLSSDENAEKIVAEGTRRTATFKYVRSFAHYPYYTDDGATYYPLGEKLFDAMCEEMEKAKKFILTEYFIVKGGKMWLRLRDLLVKKANEGVQIRFMYDDWGCINRLPFSFVKYMESLHPNIRCMAFNKIAPFINIRMNNRDHRKFCVIDGKVAFTGGINIADEYINESHPFGHWKDGGIKVVGNAANTFTVMFFNVWNAFYKEKDDVEKFITHSETKGAVNAEKKTRALVQPFDDCPFDKETLGETVYLDVIHRAKKYLYITTPYLILDDYIRDALCAAAKRGVDVRIITPGIPDKKVVFRLTRSNYPVLLNAGVKIFEYTPGFIHLKTLVSDDTSALVGTINFDYRSFYLQYENAVYCTESDVVKQVKADFENTLLSSKEIVSGAIKRGPIGKCVDSVLNIFEPLI